MSITLGQLKFDVLTLVNKTAAVKGFYTDAKMEMGFRDAQAMIATEMFIAGQGWQDKVRTIPVEAGAVSVDVPKDMTFINQVRYLFGEVWQPMTYDNMRQAPQLQPGTGINIVPWTYRILNGAFWFNPALSEASEIQVEYTTYLRGQQSNADALPANFDTSMIQFLIYHCASFCVASVGKPEPEWERWENYWYSQMRTIIFKRNNQLAYIREFE